MKTSNLFLAAATMMFAFSCAPLEIDVEPTAPADLSQAFYATIENAGGEDTKTTTNSSLYIYWDDNDELSIFNHGTHNSRYLYDYRPGWNSGVFLPYSEEDAVTGNELPYVYAVYPYSEGMTISNEGVISMTLPDVQMDCQYSFGPGANPMVAVSEDNLLKFKNVCGYLVIPLQGSDCVIKNIKLKAKGGEFIAGPATVTMPFGGVPEVSVQNGTDEITLEFSYNAHLYVDGETEFWFVLPPVTLSQGFTMTLTDEYGGTFTRSSSGEVVIQRNHISRMKQLEVSITYDSLQEVADAMYKVIGYPCRLYSNPDDMGILSALFCNDLEGADVIMPSLGYNWFSTSCSLTRNVNYRNYAIRYRSLANMIDLANKFIGKIDLTDASEEILAGLAQIRAMRAWSYMLLAQNYQFTYQTSQDQPCVPLVTESTVDPANNPRATVAEVYDLILADLDFAVNNLDGFVRTSKAQINAEVAHGLRARAHLLMGNWEAAYNDALAASANYSPATISELSKPAFYDIGEHNWIWGYDMEAGLPARAGGNGLYATTSSWLRSFSAVAYSSAAQTYCFINKLLWDKIPATDVRKGWWVDENLASPLLDGLVWPGFEDVANADDGGETKKVYLPYTNVKFGCNPIATKANEEDMPLMRAEEMILIMIEALAHTDPDEAAIWLKSFIKTFRDPSYEGSSLSLLDEIWFQRRVELWGEGFGVLDNHRLGKPVVRFHDGNSNVPEAFRFNIAAEDPVLLLPFPSTVVSANPAIVNNSVVAAPVSGQNPDLRDGVTD